ncbi:hypothetical protein QQP08_002932 [Theobroma cacao]|nr:hypothetical protein QQP08_002932 [Theobroma cacao]
MDSSGNTPTYCWITSTETVDAKSEEAKISPIAPSSGHSLQSVSPVVSGDIIPCPLPTMNKSWLLSNVLIAATVSSPLLTTFSVLNGILTWNKS